MGEGERDGGRDMQPDVRLLADHEILLNQQQEIANVHMRLARLEQRLG